MNVLLPPGTRISTRNANTLIFELPDMQHECAIMVYTNHVYMEVRQMVGTNRPISFNFDKRKASERWEDIAQSFIEKAARKYPAPLRHKSVSAERIRRGF